MRDPSPIRKDAERTLGDILGAALAAVRPSAEQELWEHARYRAARELASQIAPLLAVTQSQVFDALCTVPDNMLSLLETPEGWAALASYIAADFDAEAPRYAPSIH